MSRKKSDPAGGRVEGIAAVLDENTATITQTEIVVETAIGGAS
jgi:hypothetical protein